MPGPSTRPQDAPSGAHPPLPSHLTWTPEHEARLEYVQRELTAAQAAWSEEQDLWIDEVGSRFLFSYGFLPLPFVLKLSPSLAFRARRAVGGKVSSIRFFGLSGAGPVTRESDEAW